MRTHFFYPIVLLVLFFFSGCVNLSPEKYFSFASDSISGCENLSREKYSIPNAVFENLPPAPACFVSLVKRYQSGSFTDDYFFSSAFFSQPEFFSDFEKVGLPYWTDPLSTHWGAVGYGAYPFEKKMSVSPGSEMRARVFVHTSFGVRTFQGGVLRVELENPSQGEWVHVSLDEDSARGFLLGPTFPKFDANWVKPVDVAVRVSPNAPSMIIPVRVWMQSPPPEARDSWLARAGENYYDATSYVGERVVFRTSIEVSP